MEEHTSESLGDDWAGKATASIERAVDAVRERSLRPLEGAVRILVCSVIAAIVSIVALTTLVIGLLRLLDRDVFNHRVWASDLLIGGMFSLVGVLFLRHGSTRRRHGN